MNPDDCEDPEDRLRALGNQAADEIAQSAANLQPQLSAAELRDRGFQSGFLQRYLRYIPKALTLLPQLGPAFRFEVDPQEGGLG